MGISGSWGPSVFVGYVSVIALTSFPVVGCCFVMGVLYVRNDFGKIPLERGKGFSWKAGEEGFVSCCIDKKNKKPP
jgi:hypothetical protein